jgi:hypothetical protein
MGVGRGAPEVICRLYLSIERSITEHTVLSLSPSEEAI